jgi:hypothetical protein
VPLKSASPAPSTQRYRSSGIVELLDVELLEDELRELELGEVELEETELLLRLLLDELKLLLDELLLRLLLDELLDELLITRHSTPTVYSECC